jgi:hypothetical protein
MSKQALVAIDARVSTMKTDAFAQCGFDAKGVPIALALQ